MSKKQELEELTLKEFLNELEQGMILDSLLPPQCSNRIFDKIHNKILKGKTYFGQEKPKPFDIEKLKAWLRHKIVNLQDSGDMIVLLPDEVAELQQEIHDKIAEIEGEK